MSAQGPFVRYDAADGLIRIVEYFVPDTDLKQYFPYYLNAAGRGPVRMDLEGPIDNVEAEKRFSLTPAQRPGVYWALSAPLRPRTSFAVYFDEVWSGTDTETGRPCASTFRRVVATRAGTPQAENERDSSGLRPLVPLGQPVSVEALSSIDVMRPRRLRALDPEKAVRTIVTFRTVPFVPRSAADTANSLDTRRGFDVSLSTIGPSPAAIQYRYVVARGDDGSGLVLQRFAWLDGDALGTASLQTFGQQAPPTHAWRIRLDAGDEQFVTLRIDEAPNGSLQIVDVTR